jgi:TPR repeat protein
MASLSLNAFDYWEADREELLVLSEDGDVEAIYVLGISSMEDEDYVAAEKWFLQAAKLDHNFSHYELGEMYIKNMLPESSPEKAIMHLHKAGELGYKDAYQRLGRLYDDGKVPGQTDEETFYWAMQGTDSFPDFFSITVANYYHTGYGVEQNLPEALRWYFNAARFRRVDNALELATLCYEGIEVDQDPEMAYFWCLMAEHTAAKNDPALAEISSKLEQLIDAETRTATRAMLKEMQEYWQ